ncbi:MAG: hypothetical protein ACK51I_00735 [Chloroflexota bacterium]
MIGGFALFTWLSGGPPPPEPQGPPASAAPTPRSSAETAQATEFLSAAIRSAGLGVITGGADVRPPLPPQYNDLPRVVVRGASANDPLGIPLLAVVFPDATSAATAAPEIGAYLVLPTTLVLVPPDATFTLRRSGSLLIIFQRTPSADPDPTAAESLLTVLSTLGEEIPLPR